MEYSFSSIIDWFDFKHHLLTTSKTYAFDIENCVEYVIID